MRIYSLHRLLALFFVFGFLIGCSTKRIEVPKVAQNPAPRAEEITRPTPPAEPRAVEKAPDYSYTTRVITEEELWRISEKDPDLTPTLCRHILARLNIKAHYYISDDIEKGRPLKVPNDFSAYKSWTPLPAYVAGLSRVPKLILVAKDIFFLGWYEHGHLVEDTQICLGNSGQPTQAGIYKIEEKDPDHISRSYKNSFGRPAWMPWSMRIYEAVYIHAGDITGSNCSHGCVTLPLKPAEELFRWAESGTPVVIVESMSDLGSVLKSSTGLLASHASR